jgi:hypothetical protein
VKALIGLLACIFIFYFSALNWRRSIKAVFLLVVFEGALRKWVLPQASEMIYFLKDIVVIGAYFNFYGFSTWQRKLAYKANFINIIVFLVIGWCLFQVFNPSLGSPVVGIFGLRGYLLYIPIIWMIPSLFESEAELYKFLRSHLLLVIPVGLLGIVQFFSPATSPINAYTPDSNIGIATFGVSEFVRVTGTFSYLSGYSVYLIVCFGLLIPFLLVQQSIEWRWICIIEIFFVTVNSFMTGSRGVIITAVLLLIGYVLVKGLTQPVSMLRLLRQLILPTMIVAIAASIWFRPAIDAFWLRTTSNTDVSGRIGLMFAEPLDFIRYKELDGYGTGATHQAGPTLRATLDLPAGESLPVAVESEMGRIALELGPIGFLFWYGLRISLVIALFWTYWNVKSQFLRQLALTAFLIQAILFNGQLVFHHTFSVYYWFFSSFIFLLPRLEEIENWQREQQLLEEDVLSPYLPDSPYR